MGLSCKPIGNFKRTMIRLSNQIAKEEELRKTLKENAKTKIKAD